MPVTREQPLKLRSKMPDNGVIFSDGIEMDFLRFTAGVEATVTVAQAKGPWPFEVESGRAPVKRREKTD